MKELIAEIISTLVEDEDGQGMVEYGLILALIAVVVIAVLTGLGTSIKTKYETINNALQ